MKLGPNILSIVLSLVLSVIMIQCSSNSGNDKSVSVEVNRNYHAGSDLVDTHIQNHTIITDCCDSNNVVKTFLHNVGMFYNIDYDRPENDSISKLVYETVFHNPEISFRCQEIVLRELVYNNRFAANRLRGLVLQDIQEGSFNTQNACLLYVLVEQTLVEAPKEWMDMMSKCNQKDFS